MENLEKYQFYVILGVVLVGYLVMHMFVVAPKQTMYVRKIRSLDASTSSVEAKIAEKGMRNNKILEYYDNKKKNLENKYQQLQDYMASQDVLLERWFEDVEIREGEKEPSPQEFTDIYDDKRRNLIEIYEGLGQEKKLLKVQDEEGEKTIAEILNLQEQGDISRQEMRTKQKDFWITKGMLNIVEKGRLRQLTAFEPISRTATTKKDQEKEPFIHHYIEFSGIINYEDIPFLVETLLIGDPLLTKPVVEKKNKEGDDGDEEKAKKKPKKQPGQKFLLEILSIKVVRKSDYIPKKETVYIKHDETDVERALDDYRKAHREKLQSELPGVKISCKCRLLDYQGEKPLVKKNPQQGM